MTQRIFTPFALVALLAAPDLLAAQDTINRTLQALEDTSTLGRLDLISSVYESGLWEVDGEYRSETGVYYKLRGYFAALAPDRPVSEFKITGSLLATHGVAAFYLEPLAGGEMDWLGGYFVCDLPDLHASEAICQVTSGAGALHNVYFAVSDQLWRGRELEVEIRQPSDQDPENRYTSRYILRGRFKLEPVTNPSR